MVTTPQDIALLDVRKGIEMFRKMDVPILGLIENMSTHLCSKCGHCEAIFGEKGADELAADMDIKLLGRLPLMRDIRVQADQGVPIVMNDPKHIASKAYMDIAVAITS